MPPDSFNASLRLPPLLQFLKQSRQLHLQYISGTQPISSTPAPVYVLGNPSADLDSIISAIVYSYFASGYGHSTTTSTAAALSSSSASPPQRKRPHIPLINLPAVPSGPELRRLRPEFVTALWLSTTTGPATTATTIENPQWDKLGGGGRGGQQHSDDDTGNVLRECILTVADLKTQAADHAATGGGGGGRRWILDTTMVDWNAFPSSSSSQKATATTEKIGSLEGLPGVDFHVVGCIDHHADEGFVSTHSSSPDESSLPDPLVVELGPGSCASLVVRELRLRWLWDGGPDGSADGSATHGESQLAKLALAAILIDTNNLTAKGKVTDTDREAVSFLESKVQQEQQQQLSLQSQSQIPWTRESFFHEVSKSKQNSLDLLTLPEILDRDYKDWTEETSSSSETAGKGQQVKLGFCSCVKPIGWLIDKAKPKPTDVPISESNELLFLNALRSFSTTRDLDIIVIMTAFSDNNKFRRELLLCALHPGPDDPGERCCRSFVSRCESELGLSGWSLSSSSSSQKQGANNNNNKGHNIESLFNTDSPIWCRLWDQADVTKSRKQVAPLLRGEVARL